MLFWIILLLASSLTSGARILGVFNIPSYSHHVVYAPLYKELSRRGHEVVVITTNPLNDSSLTNLTEIDISYLYRPVAVLTKLQTDKYMEFITTMFAYGISLFEEVMVNEEVKKLVDNPKEHFDLVIVEDQPLLYSFGKRFNAPVIGILSVDTTMSTHSSLGNPIHPALYTDCLMDYSEKLSIWKKIRYTFNTIWFKLLENFIAKPAVNQVVTKYFGKHFKSFHDFGKPSMLMISVNPFFHPNRPLTPQTIPIPFMHVKQPKPLPKDLAIILDNSTQGAIYLSLGSNVKSAHLPAHLQKAIIGAISELPYTVLWKWEGKNISSLGKNVITRKWFPQQDLLAHPNIKAFVFQGGLQSSEEAILRGKPMVGLPFISEQHRNVKILESLGIAIEIEPLAMTKDSLKHAIIEVAENQKYTQKIQKLKFIAEDEPMSSLDKAVYWSEYVIRHNGTEHLKSLAADMPLYEYLLLDVILVVSMCLALGGFLTYKILKLLYRKIISLYLNNVNKIKIS
ncbi:UDP-glucuronosyltransferase 2B15-like [Sitophilus oryzae]|uniref:UDP-glucuronosyltransferase 2B15-like n=1 Tax=Sitophilus oryzae TaxID=7048 RepID=A0A6J2Y8L4_SITOR|nr:UDP-glucuronosyltransferase 2B15-like [Sitophilus oryzae]